MLSDSSNFYFKEPILKYFYTFVYALIIYSFLISETKIIILPLFWIYCQTLVFFLSKKYHLGMNQNLVIFLSENNIITTLFFLLFSQNLLIFPIWNMLFFICSLKPALEILSESSFFLLSETNIVINLLFWICSQNLVIFPF